MLAPKVSALILLVIVPLVAVLIVSAWIYRMELTSFQRFSLSSDQEAEWWENQGIILKMTDMTSNVFLEDLLKETELSENISVKVFNQNSSFIWTRQSGITLHINLSEMRLFSRWRDVTHQENDNDFVLGSKPTSNSQEFRKTFENIVDNFCREPVPDHYFLIMQPYHNRYTKAKKIICNKSQKQSGSLRCPDELFNGQIYSYRTVNDQCSMNKATHLNQDTNSFFCTQNNPLLNELFQEHISEKVVSVSQGECHRNRRFCEECIRQSCSVHLKAIEMGSSQNCCHIAAQCLLQPSCIDYYSASCYHGDVQEQQHNICMKGSTYKFTLNPQFPMNSSFMCHLRPTEGHDLYQIHLTLTIPHWLKVSFSLGETISPERIRCLPNSMIHCSYASLLMNIEHDLIRSVSYPNAIMSYDGGTYCLNKIRSTFNQSRPKVERRMDLKYSRIQISEPFGINYKNWMKRSCFQDIMHLLPYQPMHDNAFRDVVNVTRLRKVEGAYFEYILKSTKGHESINLRLKDKSSVLRSVVCSNYSDPTTRSGLSDIKVTFAQKYLRNWTWNLEIKGSFENQFEYFNIQLKEDVSSKPLINEDILVIKLPVTEINSFSLNHSLQFFPESATSLNKLKFTLLISSCLASRRYTMLLQPSFNESLFYNHSMSPSALPTISGLILPLPSFIHVLPKLCILFITFCSVLSVGLIGTFVCKMVCSTRNPSAKSKPQMFSFTNLTMRKRKYFIVAYVTLRIFYTFVFTSTCILSVILTVNLRGMVHLNEDLRPEPYQKVRTMKLYESNLDDVLKNCDKVSKAEIRLMLYKVEENLNNTISSWYLSKESLVNINMEMFSRHSENVTARIVEYFNRRIIENMSQRLADRTGLISRLVEDSSRSKWLNILSSSLELNAKYSPNLQHKHRTKISFNLFPVLSLANTQALIEKKFNFTFERLKRQEGMMKQLQGISFLRASKTSTRELHYRVFTSTIFNDNPTLNLKTMHKRPINTSIGSDDSGFSFVRVWIGLFLLDLLLIFSRCHKIYKDLQSIWFGTERFLSSKYAVLLADSSAELKIENFSFDRKTAISTYQPSPTNLVLLSSVRKIKLFKYNYYLVVVVLTGISLLIMYVFIICQSTGTAILVQSIFNVHLKNLPPDFMDLIEKRINSMLTQYHMRRKNHYEEIMLRITRDNRRIFLESLSSFQRYQQETHTEELCKILRILSRSKNNKKMKQKMQSQFFFIPLQVVDACLRPARKSATMIQGQPRTCSLSNATFAVNFRKLSRGPNPNSSELLWLIRFRDLLLIASVIFLLAFVSMNIVKLVLHSKHFVLSTPVSSVYVLNSRPPSISENLHQVDSSTCLWPLLSSQINDAHDPYFTVSCIRLPKTYPSSNRVGNRETDI